MICEYCGFPLDPREMVATSRLPAPPHTWGSYTPQEADQLDGVHVHRYCHLELRLAYTRRALHDLEESVSRRLSLLEQRECVTDPPLDVANRVARAYLEGWNDAIAREKGT